MKVVSSVLAAGALGVAATLAAPLEARQASNGSTGNIMAYPFRFTSQLYTVATPDQVVNNSNVAVPGQSGAVGYYSFGINSQSDVICYNITLVGVTGNYSSPAATATHIHQAARNVSGPPRIAFPNPVGNGTVRTSYGCLQGPFTTGLLVNGTDTGSGFRLATLEANPTGFMADVHTSQNLAGAVRGQLASGTGM